MEAMELSTALVIGSNCLLAGLVLMMATKLWRWRSELVRLTVWLRLMAIEDGDDSNAGSSAAIATRRMGLALMMKRSNIAETRLKIARLKLVSHQVNQLLTLARLLIVVSRRRRQTSRAVRRP